MGSTDRSHRGHSPVSPLNAAAIGLTAEGAAAEPAAPASAAAIGAPPVMVAPRARAADVVSGFPQSMQKRDDASFSRPQKAQVARGLTVGPGRAWEANITCAMRDARCELRGCANGFGRLRRREADFHTAPAGRTATD